MPKGRSQHEKMLQEPLDFSPERQKVSEELRQGPRAIIA